MHYTRRLNSPRERNLKKFINLNYPNINLEALLILVTGHRRENFGEGLKISVGFIHTIKKFPELQIVYQFI